MSTHTYRRARAGMVVAAGLVLAAGVVPASAGMISIDLTSTASIVTPDESFSVSVLGTSTEPIVAFGFQLVFDETLLALDTVTVEAPFTALHAPGAPSSQIAGYAFPDAPSGVDILLATVTFTARVAGIPEISIGVDPNDPTQGFAQRGTGTFSETNVTPALITVSNEQTGGGGGAGAPILPEPATLLIALGGLLGALSRRVHR